MNKIYLSLVLLLGAFCGASAQDNVFSQFFAAPTLLNPALTGMTSGPRFSAHYRNQWASLPNAYVTYAASYDQFFENANVGAGLTLFADRQGDNIWSTNAAYGFFSYNLTLKRDLYARVGVQAGYVTNRIDWNRLVFLDQLDPLTGPVDVNGIPNPSQQVRPGRETSNFFDLSIGGAIYSKNYYGGLAIHHINRPQLYWLSDEDARNSVPMRITAHIGGEFSLGKNNKLGSTPFIAPSLLFAKQRQFSQLTAGAYLGYGVIFGGAWFRYAFGNPDAVIGSVGIRKGIFKVAYSYDVTVSTLGLGNTGGSHEVSLILNFDEGERAKKKRWEKRYGNCMQIFR